MSKPSRESHLAEFKERLQAAKEHRLADRLEIARAEYQQAVAFAETHFGEESVQVDQACLELASFHEIIKEPESELIALERRVRIRKASAGIPQIVDALQDVAEFHRLQNQSVEAEAIFTEAIELCDEAIEVHQPALRYTLLYFGSFLNGKERYAEAIPVLERGLVLCKLAKSLPSITGARLSMYLAEAFLHTQRPAEAAELIDVAGPVVTHRGQAPSTKFGRIFYYLGNYYQREDRPLQAERAYDLAIQQTHQARQVNNHNLGLILQASAHNDLKLNKPVRAERRLKQAIRFLSREREAHHDEVLSVKQDLINIYIPAKQYAKAEPILEEMAAASEHADFDDDRARERFLNNLGFVQVHLEEFPKAEANLRRALRSAGEDHGCYVIKNLGLMYQKMGYVAEAIAEYRRALPLFIGHYSADHPVATFIREALVELEGPTP